MIGKTDDGQLLPAVFPFYVGQMALQTVGSEQMASFFGVPKREVMMAAAGQIGLIGDHSYRVLSINISPISRQMVRMVVERVEEAAK